MGLREGCAKGWSWEVGRTRSSDARQEVRNLLLAHEELLKVLEEANNMI